MKLRGLAFAAVLFGASITTPAAASTFAFSRTDYSLGSWTQSASASEVGSDLNLWDRPIAIADFTGDGKPDIAVSDFHRRVVHVLLNDGTGNFTFAPSNPNALNNCIGPDSLLAGDFTGDGKQDLLVDCSDDGRIRLYPGDGTGGFGAEQSSVLGGGPILRAHVLNNDDDTVFNRFGGTNNQVCYMPVVTWAGSSDLSSQETCVPGFSGGYVWASAHFYDSQCSGDEFLALKYTSGPDYDATLLELAKDGLGQCNGWATGTRDSGITGTDLPGGMAGADVDKDGIPDIVMASGSGFHVIKGGNGTNFFGMSTANFSTPGNVTALAVADFDSDGRPDLVGAEKYPSQDHNDVALLAGQGSVVAFGPPQTIPIYGDQGNYSDSPHLAVADLNGDNKPDLVTTASGGNNFQQSTVNDDKVTVLLNGSTSSTNTGPSGGNQNPGGAGSGGTFAGLQIHPQTLTVKNGAVHVAGTCPPDAFVQCVGTDTLSTIKAVSVRVERKRKRILRLGSVHFTIAAGHKASIKIKLSKAALKLLAKSRSLKAKETVVAHDQHNVAKTTSTTVTLKLAKKSRH